MVYVAPSFAPKMTDSNQPNMGALKVPEMAPPLELGETKPIHFSPRSHLRTPVAKPLQQQELTPPKPPAALVEKERAPKVQGHWFASPVMRRDPLW